MLLSVAVLSLLLCHFSATVCLFLLLLLKICCCFHNLFCLIESGGLAAIASSLIFNFNGLYELVAGLDFDSI